MPVLMLISCAPEPPGAQSESTAPEREFPAAQEAPLTGAERRRHRAELLAIASAAEAAEAEHAHQDPQAASKKKKRKRQGSANPTEQQPAADAAPASRTSHLQKADREGPGGLEGG
jgi:hypothetical protein